MEKSVGLLLAVARHAEERLATKGHRWESAGKHVYERGVAVKALIDYTTTLIDAYRRSFGVREARRLEGWVTLALRDLPLDVPAVVDVPGAVIHSYHCAEAVATQHAPQGASQAA